MEAAARLATPMYWWLHGGSSYILVAAWRQLPGWHLQYTGGCMEAAAGTSNILVAAWRQLPGWHLQYTGGCMEAAARLATPMYWWLHGGSC